MTRPTHTFLGLAAVFGLAMLASEATAQYYPIGPTYTVRPYRSLPLPPPDDMNDDPRMLPPPGIYPYRDSIESTEPRQRQALPPPDPYGPARRPFFVPEDDSTRFGTRRREDLESIIRPPGSILSAPPAATAPERGPDATGSIRTPGEPVPLQPPAVIDMGRGPADDGSARPPAGLAPRSGPALAALPPEDQPEEGPVKELPPHLKRQLVAYAGKEPAGTVVIDTQNTFLYLVLGKGKALRYGIGVGREGFTWAGNERISKMTEWPDWHPPKEMIERQPYLPRMMAGGPGNPMGARALYLGKTLYRIHGTNQPSTIGQFVSSGCIRMLNEDAEDFYGRVQIGTRVVVLPGTPPASASAPLPITR